MTGAEEMQDLLELIVEALGIDGTVVMEDDGETVTGTIEGESLGLLIGHHGSTIDAIQHLAARVVLRDGPESDRRRVVVDADGYRARRREALEAQAEGAADDAVRTEAAVALPAMSPAERRIVHEFLRDRADVDTHSEGEGAERRLVVSPAE